MIAILSAPQERAASGFAARIVVEHEMRDKEESADQVGRAFPGWLARRFPVRPPRYAERLLEGGRMGLRIVDLPENERPRERLAQVGPRGLSERELLALVLRTGGQGGSAVSLGAELIATWGSTASLAAARFEDLVRIQGLGEAKAASLMAAFELGRRALAGSVTSEPVTGPADLVALVTPALAGKPHEEVVLVVMNAANKPIRRISLSAGGADQCLLAVRDTLAAVLRNDGVAFALAHNHPSGDPTASPEDIRSTREIEAAAAGLGLRFLDHVITGGTAWTSVKQAGLI